MSSLKLLDLIKALLCVTVIGGSYSTAQEYEDDESLPNYRSLFIRVPDKRITTYAAKNISGSDVGSCARSCVQETDFECKSFDFVNLIHLCRLHTHSAERRRLHVHIGTDHYKSAYEKLFNNIPNHVVVFVHTDKVVDLTVEECARHCYLERRFKCRGFDYSRRHGTCWLTEHTPQTAGGAQWYADFDYYERIPESALRNFINYGFGALRTETGNVYNYVASNVTLERCASLCMKRGEPGCMSFDYNFTASRCMMSSKLPANVYGLQLHHAEGVRIMHYERKGKHIKYFYTTPYSLITGHNEVVYKRVTPELCARHCLMEQSFICRSFDYEIQGGVCFLTSVTGSDIGGLFTRRRTQGHHFEMKPILDCGGNLTSDEGDVASPNWPRQYAPNEHCVWNIRVSPYKIIHFKFVHFNLSVVPRDPCSADSDRLLIREGSGGDECITPSTFHQRHLTETNQVTLTFISNSVKDGPGFHVFYMAEWPCIATLTQSYGEFASPDWPRLYPAGSECNWNIRAPEGYTISVTFTQFEMDHREHNRCTRGRDHVEVYDSDHSAPRALLCGSYNSSYTIESITNSLLVKMASTITSSSSEGIGFHARYQFKQLPTTTTTTTTTTTVVTTTVPSTPTTRLPMKTRKAQESGAVSSTEGDFIKPTERDTSYKFNVTIDGGQGDLNRPGDKHKSRDSESINSTLWAVSIVITILVICVAVGGFLFCRYRRKRVPKPCPPKTRSITAECSALCSERELTPPDVVVQSQPTNTTSFANPLYETAPRKSSRKKSVSKVTMSPVKT